MFSAVGVVLRVQADGQSRSGCSSGPQTHVRRHFGILIYKVHAIYVLVYELLEEMLMHGTCRENGSHVIVM